MIKPHSIPDAKSKWPITDSGPVFESMPHLSGTIGMPIGIVKALKAAGCPAFVAGNRVQLYPLLRQFFAEFGGGDSESAPPDGLPTWREALNRVQTQREEVKLAKEKGELMPTADAERMAGEAMGYCFAELERITVELPPAMAGMGAVEIHKRISGEVERMRRALVEKFEAIK